MTWIVTMIGTNGTTLLVWWLRLRWEARQERAHRRDLIALVLGLPDGEEIHERHSNGTCTRLVITRARDE